MATFTIIDRSGRDNAPRAKFTAGEILDRFGSYTPEDDSPFAETVGQWIRHCDSGDTYSIDADAIDIVCIDRDEVERDPQPVYRRGKFVGNLYVSFDHVNGLRIVGRDAGIPDRVDDIYFGDDTDESEFSFSN